jgi:hypothetical protein
MCRFASSFALAAAVLFATCVVPIEAEQSRGVQRERDVNRGYLRSPAGGAGQYVTSIANEAHRALGKSGKGAKAYSSSNVSADSTRSASGECVKWETSTVTELKPQYYYWRPYSSKSSKAAGSQSQYTTYQPKYYYYGKSGKGSKGGKGRKLHDQVMVKYIEVEKEVKTCVEYDSQNLFTASGKSGKAGGKAGKSGGYTVNQISSTEGSKDENDTTTPVTESTDEATSPAPVSSSD